MSFEYKMVQLPQNIVVKAAEHRGNEAAAYLQQVVSQNATEGWEFYRVDEIGVVTKPGCLGGLLGGKAEYIQYYVVTFRRAH